ncbi:MAG TPA: hypothetical protein VD994_03225 [Prosthecobacter sp.]|nr:hypothetical protein [Prosthecobacter sp.]
MTEPVLPDVMNKEEVAAFMRCSPKSILNRLARGTFMPLPFAERPYRWRGTDLLRWWRGEFRDAEEKLRSRARRLRAVS